MMFCQKRGELKVQVHHFILLQLSSAFTIFHVGNHGDVYLGKNHAWSIEGIIGTMHLTMDGTNELVYKM